MAGTFINALPAAPSAQLTDVFPVDQLPGPITYKESNAQLLSLFQANGTALSSVNDTNVTMTLGGSPTIALLNPTSMTLGWTGTLSPARGGTGVNNGTSTLNLGGNLTTSGAFASTFTMTNTTSVTFPTSGTLATVGSSVTSVSGTANRITSTGGTTPVIDISASYVGQSSITTLGTIGTGVWQGTVLGSTYGGTGVNNGSSTFTMGGSHTLSGAFASTFTFTNTTSVTFPTSGTLATTSQLPTPAALTKADDTNVTLTLGGTPTTALLQATSITAGWTGTLSGTRGGTGTNNGASTATYGGNLNFASSFATSGAFAVTQTYTGVTNVTFPTSGTLATTSQIPTGAALTKSDDTNVTLTLGGSPTTALVNAASITAGWTGTLAVGRGGTGVSSVTTAPAASSFAGWDANKNLSANSHIDGYATTVTAAGTTTLVVGSANQQFFTGTSTQTVVLPVASTLVLGQIFRIVNNSTGAVTVQSSGANNITVMAGGTVGIFTVILASGTTAASWSAEYVANTAAISTVTKQTFIANGTYTPTANMKYAIIECYGSGGGGSGVANGGATQLNVGGGGGAGGYSRTVATAATVGASQVVTVGAAGAGGAAGTNPGAVGHVTSVGSICIANGGSGGAAALGGAGGTAGTGDLTATGANGQTGANSNNTAVAAFPAGSGASSPLGSGGQGTIIQATGASATGFAAGGASGSTNNAGGAAAGGAGSGGYVFITEYI